jgi:excisionase family DNA binding protein
VSFAPRADRLLTAAEVADLLAVPTRWIREHTRGGLIPHVKLGRYVRYDRADVLAWIDAQKVGGAAWRKHRPKATP